MPAKKMLAGLFGGEGKKPMPSKKPMGMGEEFDMNEDEMAGEEDETPLMAEAKAVRAALDGGDDEELAAALESFVRACKAESEEPGEEAY